MDNTEFKISVQFIVRRGVKIACGTYGWYLDHPGLTEGYHTGTQASAKKSLAARAMAEVEAALAATEPRHQRRMFIRCKDGRVILVSWRVCWGYDTVDAGKVGGSSFGGAKSFDEICKRAREHAEQCFGGIAWEAVLP